IGNNGIGVKLPGAAQVVTNDKSGQIVINAGNDAEVNGVLVAGGQVINHRDSLGKLIGSSYETFDGDSTIQITSGHQVRLGRDLLAGKKIEIRGGIDPVDGTDFSGNGVVLGGTVHLKTWKSNSEIILSASGDTKILAPAWTEELVFDGFTEFADGHISQDVTLKVSVDLGSGFVDKDIVILASDTVGNSGIASLKEDIQNSLNTAYGFDVSDPKVVVRLNDGRFMFTGAYSTKIKTGSTNAHLVGIKSTTVLESSRTFAIDAKESGSTISIGQKDSPNGAIYLAGKLRAYKAINLYSGTNTDGSQNFTLGATGVIETLSGSIVMNPGDQGEILGDIIARGRGADIIIISKDTLHIKGSLTAQDDIYISAGTDLVAGEKSITTYGTATFTTLDDYGKIKIT
ncbi:hypothetical protein MJH12_12470, partial [bacterium]|nr:hypothetical protein [bacterium]